MIGESPERVRSVRLTGVRAAAPAAGAVAVAVAGIGTTVTALGNCSLATTSERLSALKLIASPCGDGGSAIR
jgi:hypothetical protein